MGDKSAKEKAGDFFRRGEDDGTVLEDAWREG